MDPSAELFARFRARGDLDALGTVFDTLAPRLLPVALHLCGDPGDAEDAVQQTFLIAIERADTFDADQRLEPWLAGILTNVARNVRRQARRRPTTELPNLATDGVGPLDEATRRDLVAHLRTHVDELPAEQRQALLMQLQHGLAPAEIAEALGVPAGTVRMRLHRGLRALRRLLPASLAGVIAANLQASGLGVVRAAVMQAGREHAAAAALAGTTAAAVATVSSNVGAYLAMKKGIVWAAVVLCCFVAWQALSPPAPPQPAAGMSDERATAAVGSSIGQTIEPTNDDDVTELTGDRTAANGALRIRTITATAEGRELPLPGTFVVVWRGEAQFEPIDAGTRRLRTDRNGELALAGLAPGTWNACVPATAVDRRTVTVPAGEEAILEFRKPVRKLLRGVVVDHSGNPVPGADIRLQRSSGLGRFMIPEPNELTSRRAGVSGDDGRFEIATVDFREQIVSANRSGYGESRGRYVNNARNELRLVLVPGEAKITGVVRGAAGTPIADALVTVQTGERDSRRMADGTLLAGRVRRLVRTDKAGRYRFDGLAPGQQNLTAWAPPLCSAFTKLELSAGQTRAVDFELKDGVVVVGTVRHNDGSPIRAGVESRPDLATNGHFSQCGVRPDGTFFLGYQPRRPFVVVVSTGGADVASREIDEAESGVVHCDFVLDPDRFVRGRVVGPTGEPLAGWRVTAEADDAEQTTTITPTNGTFALPVAPNAVITISTRPDDGRVAAASQANVRAGATVELQVLERDMPRASIRGRLLTADGLPVAGRRMLLRRGRGGSRRTDTAADGSFAFTDLVAATWTLQHLAGGNRAQLGEPIDLTLTPQHDCGDIVLPATGTLVPELLDAAGRPWTAEPVGILLKDQDGNSVPTVHSFASGGLTVKAPPGTYELAVNATDVIAAPQQVTLEANRETRVRLELKIGRTRKITFNGDGKERPDATTPLRVTIRAVDDSIVLQQDVTRLYPDLRGFRYWYVRDVFAFGRYQVEAHTEDGLRYHGWIEIGEDVEAPTTIDVPQVESK